MEVRITNIVDLDSFKRGKRGRNISQMRQDFSRSLKHSFSTKSADGDHEEDTEPNHKRRPNAKLKTDAAKPTTLPNDPSEKAGIQLKNEISTDATRTIETPKI